MGVYEANDAVMKCQRMWRRIGGLLDKAAAEAASKGYAARSLELGTAAEAAYWQATGELDTFDVKDCLPHRNAEPIHRRDGDEG